MGSASPLSQKAYVSGGDNIPPMGNYSVSVANVAAYLVKIHSPCWTNWYWEVLLRVRWGDEREGEFPPLRKGDD